jgi:bacterioferritin (cytochrome b1)
VSEYRPLVRLSDKEIMDSLNLALLAEFRAIADYDAHAQGTDQPEIRTALETLRDVEQEHAMRLVSRITALGGRPADPAPVARTPGDSLTSWITRDLQGEQWAIVEYARLVAGILDDDETAYLMSELLADEIRHAAWLRTTLRGLQAGAGPR